VTISVRGATTAIAGFATMLGIIGLFYAVQFAPRQADSLAPYVSPAIIRLFDLDTEGNIPTWYESSLFLVAAGLCGLFAGARPAGGAGVWRILAVIFLVMSCDETAMLHELVGRYLSAAERWKRLDIYGWLLLGAPLAGGIVLVVRRAARALDAPARGRLILAGTLFFLGSIGVESVEAVTDARIYGTVAFGLLTWGEECLELTGIILFIHAMMTVLRDRAEAVGVTFVS
jgi:hypothetical protein